MGGKNSGNQAALYEANDGLHSYTMKETEWDDLNYEEFMGFDDGFDVNDVHRVKRDLSTRNNSITTQQGKENGITGSGDCFNEQNWNNTFPYDVTSASSLPPNIDWTKKGYVTSVKSQKGCGACWAIASVGALEGQWFKKTGKLVSLSPWFLVNCSQSNNGCKGGLPSRAFRDLKNLRGIPSEAAYPYNATNYGCENIEFTTHISGYKTINSEMKLLNALAYIGPVTAGIKTGPKLRSIGSGVFTDCQGDVNHAVLVVGYGVYNGVKVWKIKNSWGERWGDKGYFYMDGNSAKGCGLFRYASYPILDGVHRGDVSTGEVVSLGEVVNLESISGCNGNQVSLLALVATTVCVALFGNQPPNDWM